MRTEPKLLGFYNYTVILTYIGMLSGFIGIIYAFEGHITSSIICLMISGFCDMFDGAVASTKTRTDQEKCFGIQIDSLSDLICFGVLPAIIVYSMNKHNPVILGISSLYVLCALIRLAYFNVDEQERQKTSIGSRETYFGLPVTLSALLLPVFYGIGKAFDWNNNTHLSVLMFIMSAMFLLPFQLKKPKLFGKIVIVLCGLLEIVIVAFTCFEP